ncbi:MAG TPA: IclR family transcriptional regulator [Solirubrobacterales bacterium]|nr:IclR family transcriptional regulator [Solirubrobacterales bacterium]
MSNGVATGKDFKGPAQSPTGFQSVARAAELLGMFTIERPELSLSEITERLEVSKPTAHRYATALRQAGLLRQADGVYALGPRVVELASAALAGLGVINVARPHLERLGADTAQTAVLSVWDGEAPVVVRVHDAPTGRMIRIVVTTGSRLPRESAQGLVFAAFLEPENHDPRLEKVRRERVAYLPDVVEGIAALAAPVFQGEEIVATIALVGTIAGIASGPRTATARTLRDAATALSLELGHVVEEGA